MNRIVSLITALLLFVPFAGRARSFSAAPAGAGGATDLTLAPGLSFTDDSSVNFPIRGRHLDDGQIASDRPTIVFFGTSHCWNTNREAERLVAFFGRHKDDARFVVVDLDRVSPPQRSLVENLYRGYIPTVAVFNARGEIVYDRSGETSRARADIRGLEEIFSKTK
jgi:hypothetical protein